MKTERHCDPNAHLITHLLVSVENYFTESRQWTTAAAIAKEVDARLLEHRTTHPDCIELNRDVQVLRSHALCDVARKVRDADLAAVGNRP